MQQVFKNALEHIVLCTLTVGETTAQQLKNLEDVNFLRYVNTDELFPGSTREGDFLKVPTSNGFFKVYSDESCILNLIARGLKTKRKRAIGNQRAKGLQKFVKETAESIAAAHRSVAFYSKETDRRSKLLKESAQQRTKLSYYGTKALDFSKIIHSEVSKLMNAC